MEQQIVSGIVANGPGYAAAAALFWLFWKFIQSQIAADGAQSQQRIDDLKEENKTQTEFLMSELKEMKMEMQKREEESQRREDKLYDLITKELRQINGKLDRRAYDEDIGQVETTINDLNKYSGDSLAADLFPEVARLGGRPGHIRPGQSRE